MTYQPLTIKTDDLTVGRLADWLDKARSAGAVDDQPIGLEATDSEGNPMAAHNHSAPTAAWSPTARWSARSPTNPAGSRADSLAVNPHWLR